MSSSAHDTPDDRTYRGDGIRFRYPADWDVSEEPGAEQHAIHLQSGGTSFGTIVLLYGRPTARRAVETAVAAFREEYADVDEYPVSTRLAGRKGAGCDLDFVCLELCSAAFLRAIRAVRFTVLVLFQSSDDEVEQARGALERVCESLDCDSDALVG